MHILYVEHGYPGKSGGGGAGTYIQLVGWEMVRRGHQVSVLASYQDSSSTISEDDGVVVYRPKIQAPYHYYFSKLPLLGQLAIIARYIEHGFHIYRFIEQLHKENPIDVIEFTEGGDFWHAWRRSFPIVVNLHGSRYTVLKQSGRKTKRSDWWQRKLGLMFIQRTDHIVSPSKALLDIVSVEAGPLRPPTTVIPLPLDSTLLDKARDKSNRPARILFAARNDPVKGAEVLLQAALIVAQQVPAAELHFFGFRPNPGQHVPVNVVIHPFIPKSELFEWYSRVDVCVVPSRWENSPNTVYEAMAAGLPVVSTRVGGIPELVEDGRTGLLVTSGDANGLANALVELLLNSDRRTVLGLAAKERIIQIADLEQNVDQRLHIFQELITPRL